MAPCAAAAALLLCYAAGAATPQQGGPQVGALGALSGVPRAARRAARRGVRLTAAWRQVQSTAASGAATLRRAARLAARVSPAAAAGSSALPPARRSAAAQQAGSTRTACFGAPASVVRLQTDGRCRYSDTLGAYYTAGCTAAAGAQYAVHDPKPGSGCDGQQADSCCHTGNHLRAFRMPATGLQRCTREGDSWAIIMCEDGVLEEKLWRGLPGGGVHSRPPVPVMQTTGAGPAVCKPANSVSRSSYVADATCRSGTASDGTAISYMASCTAPGEGPYCKAFKQRTQAVDRRCKDCAENEEDVGVGAARCQLGQKPFGVKCQSVPSCFSDYADVMASDSMLPCLLEMGMDSVMLDVLLAMQRGKLQAGGCSVNDTRGGPSNSSSCLVQFLEMGGIAARCQDCDDDGGGELPACRPGQSEYGVKCRSRPDCFQDIANMMRTAFRCMNATAVPVDSPRPGEPGADIFDNMFGGGGVGVEIIVMSLRSKFAAAGCDTSDPGAPPGGGLPPAAACITLWTRSSQVDKRCKDCNDDGPDDGLPGCLPGQDEFGRKCQTEPGCFADYVAIFGSPEGQRCISAIPQVANLTTAFNMSFTDLLALTFQRNGCAADATGGGRGSCESFWAAWEAADGDCRDCEDDGGSPRVPRCRAGQDPFGVKCSGRVQECYRKYDDALADPSSDRCMRTAVGVGKADVQLWLRSTLAGSCGMAYPSPGPEQPPLPVAPWDSMGQKVDVRCPELFAHFDALDAVCKDCLMSEEQAPEDAPSGEESSAEDAPVEEAPVEEAPEEEAPEEEAPEEEAPEEEAPLDEDAPEEEEAPEDPGVGLYDAGADAPAAGDYGGPQPDYSGATEAPFINYYDSDAPHTERPAGAYGRPPQCLPSQSEWGGKCQRQPRCFEGYYKALSAPGAIACINRVYPGASMRDVVDKTQSDMRAAGCRAELPVAPPRDRCDRIHRAWEEVDMRCKDCVPGNLTNSTHPTHTVGMKLPACNGTQRPWAQKCKREPDCFASYVRLATTPNVSECLPPVHGLNRSALERLSRIRDAFAAANCSTANRSSEDAYCDSFAVAARAADLACKDCSDGDETAELPPCAAGQSEFGAKCKGNASSCFARYSALIARPEAPKCLRSDLRWLPEKMLYAGLAADLNSHGCNITDGADCSDFNGELRTVDEQCKDCDDSDAGTPWLRRCSSPQQSPWGTKCATRPNCFAHYKRLSERADAVRCVSAFYYSPLAKLMRDLAAGLVSQGCRGPDTNPPGPTGPPLPGGAQCAEWLARLVALDVRCRDCIPVGMEPGIVECDRAQPEFGEKCKAEAGCWSSYEALYGHPSATECMANAPGQRAPSAAQLLQRLQAQFQAAGCPTEPSPGNTTSGDEKCVRVYADFEVVDLDCKDCDDGWSPEITPVCNGRPPYGVKCRGPGGAACFERYREIFGRPETDGCLRAVWGDALGGASTATMVSGLASAMRQAHCHVPVPNVTVSPIPAPGDNGGAGCLPHLARLGEWDTRCKDCDEDGDDGDLPGCSPGQGEYGVKCQRADCLSDLVDKLENTPLGGCLQNFIGAPVTVLLQGIAGDMARAGCPVANYTHLLPARVQVFNGASCTGPLREAFYGVPGECMTSRRSEPSHVNLQCSGGTLHVDGYSAAPVVLPPGAGADEDCPKLPGCCGRGALEGRQQCGQGSGQCPAGAVLTPTGRCNFCLPDGLTRASLTLARTLIGARWCPWGQTLLSETQLEQQVLQFDGDWVGIAAGLYLRIDVNGGTWRAVSGHKGGDGADQAEVTSGTMQFDREVVVDNGWEQGAEELRWIRVSRNITYHSLSSQVPTVVHFLMRVSQGADGPELWGAFDGGDTPEKGWDPSWARAKAVRMYHARRPLPRALPLSLFGGRFGGAADLAWVTLRRYENPDCSGGQGTAYAANGTCFYPASWGGSWSVYVSPSAASGQASSVSYLKYGSRDCSGSPSDSKELSRLCNSELGVALAAPRATEVSTAEPVLRMEWAQPAPAAAGAAPWEMDSASSCPAARMPAIMTYGECALEGAGSGERTARVIECLAPGVAAMYTQQGNGSCAGALAFPTSFELLSVGDCTCSAAASGQPLYGGRLYNALVGCGVTRSVCRLTPPAVTLSTVLRGVDVSIFRTPAGRKAHLSAIAKALRDGGAAAPSSRLSISKVEQYLRGSWAEVALAAAAEERRPHRLQAAEGDLRVTVAVAPSESGDDNAALLQSAAASSFNERYAAQMTAEMTAANMEPGALSVVSAGAERNPELVYTESPTALVPTASPLGTLAPWALRTRAPLDYQIEVSSEGPRWSVIIPVAVGAAIIVLAGAACCWVRSRRAQLPPPQRDGGEVQMSATPSASPGSHLQQAAAPPVAGIPVAGVSNPMTELDEARAAGKGRDLHALPAASPPAAPASGPAGAAV